MLNGSYLNSLLTYTVQIKSDGSYIGLHYTHHHLKNWLSENPKILRMQFSKILYFSLLDACSTIALGLDVPKQAIWVPWVYCDLHLIWHYTCNNCFLFVEGSPLLTTYCCKLSVMIKWQVTTNLRHLPCPLLWISACSKHVVEETAAVLDKKIMWFWCFFMLKIYQNIFRLQTISHIKGINYSNGTTFNTPRY